MKVCYLDFDGVLHADRVYFHPRRGIYMGNDGGKLFEWVSILEELLMPYPDVSIVLSTSWVHRFSFTFAKEKLSTSLQARVVGATFHKRHMRKDEFIEQPRGVQIAQDVYRRAPKAWFAIDDDANGWPAWYQDRLVHTDEILGLSDPTTQLHVRQKLAEMKNS